MHFLEFLFITFKLIFILFLDFLTHIFRSQNKIKNKEKKTTILAEGRQQSPLLLTFSRTILRLSLIISALFLLILSFQAPSLFHCFPNPLQLGYVFYLALCQVLKRLSDSLVLLYEFLEYLFNNTQNHAISGNYGQDVVVGVRYTLLLNSDVLGACQKPAKRKLSVKKKT